MSATFFEAWDDREAVEKARAFYRISPYQKGFKLWQGPRLVKSEEA